MSEEHTTLAVGSLLRGRYLIKSVLGSEIAGTTYLVKDQQAKNMKYQLFVLKEITNLDQQARYQFTFNSTALRKLHHPALPVIHHIFNDDKRGCVYLVTDYIEGVNLETLRLQQPSQRLNWPELRALCEPIVGALTYLHRQEKQIFHGDLRPTNVIQSITGKTLSFNPGYTQVSTFKKRARVSSVASINYYAPEQFTGEIDERSDVYGLGATFYTLLTGKVPIDALSRLARVNKKKTDPLARASKVAPGVPRLLADALQKALALNPAERFQSIKEFWQTLCALPIPVEAMPAAGNQSIGTTPILNSRASAPPQTDAVRRDKHRRSFLSTLLILCTMLLLFTSAGTWAWASAHSHAALSGKSRSGTPSDQQRSPTADGPASTSGSSTYSTIIGTYRGTLTFFSGLNTTFTLYITYQVQDQFRGNFVSPLQKGEGTVIGTIDTAKNVDLDMTFIDTSNNALLYFYGGFNGIFGSQINTQDSGAGTFVKCIPHNGPTCHVDSTSNSGGFWTLNFESSAFTAPVLPRS